MTSKYDRLADHLAVYLNALAEGDQVRGREQARPVTRGAQERDHDRPDVTAIACDQHFHRYPHEN